MAQSAVTRYSFNRGLISPLAIARVDLKRSALSAEVMMNWMPRRLGPMMLRPGLQFIGSSRGNDVARYISFIASITAMALLEFTDGFMRVWVDDEVLARDEVSSAVTNGNFTSNLTGWTDSDEAGGTSAWVTGGYMGLTGNGTAAAIRDQEVTVASADEDDEHALRIIVQRGPVTLRVGSTLGNDDYIEEATLYTGSHSLAFTPTGNFFIRLMSRLKRQVLVDSCNVEGAGDVSIPSPYAEDDLDNIRADTESQSADVLFVACVGYTQRRVERRSQRSWSIVLYQSDNGPFLTENTGTMTLTPSVLSGNGTLTASRSFFRATHAPSTDNGGALFKVTSTGQTVTTSITAQNTFTNAIRVTGVGNDRAVAITITGLSGTTSQVTLQRSLDSDTGPWADVSGTGPWTADTAESFNDTLENQIAWYRIGVKTGDYVAGTIVPTLTYPSGSITGVCRVTSYTSATVVNIEVLTEFGAITASDDWAEGRWSDLRSWPTAGTFYEGRLWWSGKDRLQGSESDQFDGFDPDAEGDAGPIDRSIGAGPLTTINWLLPLQRLMLGAQTAEFSARSNSLDEPLTPTNFNIKQSSNQGSFEVAAVKKDSRGIFVQRGGTRVFDLVFNSQEGYDYTSRDLTLLNPEVCEPYVVRMALQRQPDTRLHCVLSDGTAAVLVYDPDEEVLCWSKVESVSYDEDGEVIVTGLIEDVVIQPGTTGQAEDRVYYLVQRTIDGDTKRRLEKWALESECRGGTLNKQADSFTVFENSVASYTVTGLDHLIGETVIAWGDGVCMADEDGNINTFVVSASGEITLRHYGDLFRAVTGVVGLPYRARWQSAKLGQTLSKHKNVETIGPILKDTHARGITMGPDFDHLDPLPLTYQGTAVDLDRVYTAYDEQPQPFPGVWSVDARICLEANAPRPANILAFTISGQVT